METYQLEKYLLPVWEGDTVYHETVLFLGEEDFAPLLYPATEIVSVYDYGLQIEYVEGKDYQLVNGGIKRIKGGKTPFMAIDDYYLTEPAQFAISIVNRNEKAPEGKKYFSFGEKDSYSKYQIAVTYKHNAKKSIEIPQTKKERFKNFNDKIKNSKPVTIVFYGDSITMGCNTSGTPMGGETPLIWINLA
ncbi:MAG: hypothetical protein IJV99_01400 [Clostridia bacterium]|nr:hypothetical protein [Clostridia bacterium]